MPATLGYWGARGLAQHIKFLMEFAGEEYNEKRYKSGPAPDYDRSQWLDEKFSFGLDFPNLPYYIDGDIKITQSGAITRYLARKHNLIANKTEENIIKSDILENEALDLRYHFVRVCYSPDFEKLKVDFINVTMPGKFGQLSKYLGDNKWFFGDKITFVDFVFYEIFSAIKELTPASFDEFENLKKFMTRFETLEPIKKYMESDRYISWPYNGPMASFGGKPRT